MPTPLAALLLVLVATPAPQEAQPAPTDALVVVSRGLEALAPDAADQPVLGLIGELAGFLRAKAAESETELAGLELAGRWLARPLTLRAGVSGDGKPRLHLSVRFASLQSAQAELAELRQTLLAQGVSLVPSGDEPQRLWTATPQGPLALTADGDGDGGVLTIALGRPLAAEAAEPQVGLQLGSDPALVVEWNGRALTPALETLAARDDPAAGRFAELLRQLDLAGPDAPRRTFALAHSDEALLAVQRVEGWTGTHTGAVGATPLTPADLRLVPADALWASLGNLHPARLVEIGRALDDEATAKVLDFVTRRARIDLELDVLGALGPIVGAYAGPSTSGTPWGGLVLFARSEDPSALLGGLRRLLEAVPSQNGKRPVREETWQYQGHTCRSLSFPGMPIPLQPSFVATDEVLLVALERSALHGALDQLGAETSLLDHAWLAGMDAERFAGLVGFSFLDAPACLAQGRAKVGMALAMAGNMLLGEGGPDISGAVPSARVLGESLRPSISRTYVSGADLVTVAYHGRSWVARGVAALGSPLGELNPMVTSVAAAVAIPKLLAARLSANEAAAVSNLRAIAAAQARFQAAGALDSDGDGLGEFGLLGELAGAQVVRGSRERLDPPMLARAWGELVPDGQGGALVSRSGYWIQVWLPASRGKALTDSARAGGGLESADPDRAERHWCAYAWPMEVGTTGVRAFYIDQHGEVFATANRRQPYAGLPSDEGGRAPRFDAAQGREGDLGRTTPVESAPTNDTNLWSPVL